MLDAVLIGPGGGLGIALDIRRPVEATTEIFGLAHSSSSDCDGYRCGDEVDEVVKTTSMGVMGERG